MREAEACGGARQRAKVLPSGGGLQDQVGKYDGSSESQDGVSGGRSVSGMEWEGQQCEPHQLIHCQACWKWEI